MTGAHDTSGQDTSGQAGAKKRVLIASGNAKKAGELEAILGEGYTAVTLKDAGLSHIDIVEDGDTFAKNAAIKVDTIRAHLEDAAGGPFVAVVGDDSGLCVDALDGGPGIRSARFAKDHDAGAGDADNNALLFKMLDGQTARGAHFACAICLHDLTRDTRVETYGTVPGTIATDLKGTGGFGYDPLFIPDAHPDKRMAELSAAEKHAISHRGVALRAAVKAWLG